MRPRAELFTRLSRDVFYDAIEAAIKQVGNTKFLVSRPIFEIRNIDNCTTQDEVEATLDRVLEEMKGEINVHLRAQCIKAKVGWPSWIWMSRRQTNCSRQPASRWVRRCINYKVRRRILVP